MKHFILGFAAVLSLLAILVYIGITQSDTDDMLLKYRRQAPFSEYEMTYHYVGKPWFGKGLIFYHPLFPTLPVLQATDRMKVTLSPFDRVFYFSGLTLHIAKTLQNHKNLLSELRSFHAPDDFLTHPLEGLAILGFDTFRGDAQISLHEQQDSSLLRLQVSHRKQLILEAQVPLSPTLDNRLWAWTDCTFQKGKITISSPVFLRHIADYYHALGQDAPRSLEYALSHQEPFTITFDLQSPLPISSLLKGNTHAKANE